MLNLSLDKEIADKIIKEDVKISPQEVKALLLQVATTLEVLHQQTQNSTIIIIKFKIVAVNHRKALLSMDNIQNIRIRIKFPIKSITNQTILLLIVGIGMITLINLKNFPKY